LRSDYVTCRWSSTLLTDMETGELPWTSVERSSSEQDFVQLVDGVRHCWTLENGHVAVFTIGVSILQSHWMRDDDWT